jgi:hypothetical protein
MVIVNFTDEKMSPLRLKINHILLQMSARLLYSYA